MGPAPLKPNGCQALVGPGRGRDAHRQVGGQTGGSAVGAGCPPAGGDHPAGETELGSRRGARGGQAPPETQCEGALVGPWCGAAVGAQGGPAG